MTPHYWNAATAHLSQQCPILGGIIARYEGETLQQRPDGFFTLLRAVVGQQISVKAADSVWAKLIKAVKPLTPEKLLRVRDTTLRGCGLSGQKVLYAKNVARFFVERAAAGSEVPPPAGGRLGGGLKQVATSASAPLPSSPLRGEELAPPNHPTYWNAFSDEEIIRELTTIKGIGTWTAEMFLIFHLLRTDVLPVKDLGLLKAIDRHYPSKKVRKPADYQKIAEDWRPYRSIATWYLWRALDPVPVAY